MLYKSLTKLIRHLIRFNLFFILLCIVLNQNNIKLVNTNVIAIDDLLTPITSSSSFIASSPSLSIQNNKNGQNKNIIAKQKILDNKIKRSLLSTSGFYRERTIGCLFSDVCLSDTEFCFDDKAFGRCEPYDESKRSNYRYNLDRKTIQLLEQELTRLVSDGFDWSDPYSQCILKTILNDRPRTLYDKSKCDDKLLASEQQQTNNIDTLDQQLPFNDQNTNNQNLEKLLDLIEKVMPNENDQQQAAGEVTSFQLITPDINPTVTSNIKLTNLNKESLPNIPYPSSSSSSPQSSVSPTSSNNNPTFQQISLNNPLNENDNDNDNDNDHDQQQEQQNERDLVDDLSLRMMLMPKIQRHQTIQVTNNNDNNDAQQFRNRKSVKTNYDIEGNFNADNFNEDNYKDLINYLKRVIVDDEANNDDDERLKQDLIDVQQHKFFSKHDGTDDDGQYYTNSRIIASKSPIMSMILNKLPEIRVIRDTDIDDNSDIIFDKEPTIDSIDPSHDLPLIESPEDILIFDLDNDDPNDNENINNNNNDDIDISDLFDDNGNEKITESKNLGNFFLKTTEADMYPQEDDNDDDENVKIEIENENDNNNYDDDDEQMKEILFGDVNYSNQLFMPNFYRNHRYDIKKPGPFYWEDYIMEATRSNGKSNSKSTSKTTKDNNKKETKENDTSLSKKNFSIQSNEPVVEGPVKLESAQSENLLIIRTANEGEATNLEAIDSTQTYIVTDKMLGEEDSAKFLQTIEQVFNLPRGTFSNLRKDNYKITFKVNPNYLELNASQVASRIEDSADLIRDITGYSVKETGIGDKIHLPVISPLLQKKSSEHLLRMMILVVSITLASITGAMLLVVLKRNTTVKEKIKGFMKLSEDWLKFDYQELCRQRFQCKKAKNADPEANKDTSVPGTATKENKGTTGQVTKIRSSSSDGQAGPTSPSSRSSTSSWVEEPVSTNMDITTGHIILSYMEDHLKNKNRLDKEWEALCAYEADPCSTNAALQKQNTSKNRYSKILPYDHSRVLLNDTANKNNSDYINANTITDYDPRNPAYIATQGPLPNTKADFWQMIWEQGSVLIVMLTRLRENGLNMCERYWPEEGFEKFDSFEVHLVSEHIWCDDYLVRSFYLKNLKTGETRTVTQFHFLSWPENTVPNNLKSILDFRRKVNKSYKGRSCPIVVHCNDGIGRTGTYILIDMVLNRLSKGAKEIDLAASLEHIRDQRAGMVKTKAQFEFVLLAVADEVQAILKSIGQP